MIKLLAFLLLGVCMVNSKPLNILFDGTDPTKIHAVLVSAAPSNQEYMWNINYGLEAEVARAYHVLRDNGVPEDNIILFYNGGFANDKERNPFPGKLYTDKNMSRNYAEGLRVDYTGNEINESNYVAVLSGDSEKVVGGSGRVLNSTAENRVFVYHESHGLPGLWQANQGFITRKQLNEALERATKKGLFKELVFYVVACKSGSMFNGSLSDDGKIYALTTAGPDEDARFKDVLNVNVSGRVYSICINTEFGDAWLTDAQNQASNTETLEQQFEDVVKPQVVSSHARQYGNLNIAKQPITNFEGVDKDSGTNVNRKFEQTNNEDSLPIAPIAAYIQLKRNLKKSTNFGEQNELKKKLNEMEKERVQINSKIETIVHSFVGNENFGSVMQEMKQPPMQINQVECHHDVVTAFWKKCKNIKQSPFVEDFVIPMVNLCETGNPTQKIIEQVKQHCF